MVNGSEDVPDDFQSYFTIDAPFLLKGERSEVFAGKKGSTLPGKIVLKSFISDVEYLKGKYVGLELWSTQNAVVGRAVIPLEDYLTEKSLETNEPQTFLVNLIYGGCKNGTLKGTISFERLPPKPKGGSILGTNIKEFMIPDYKP